MSDIENRLISLETKFDMFLGEMRDRDNQRAAEIIEMRHKHDADMKEMRQKHDADMQEMRQRQDAAQAKHDADMEKINQKIDDSIEAMRQNSDNISRHIQALVIAAVVGIAAVVTSVLMSVWQDHKQPAPQNPPAQNQSVHFAGKNLYAAKISAEESDLYVS